MQLPKKGQLSLEFASRLGNLLKLFIPHYQSKLRWCLIYLTASQKPSLVAVDTMSRIRGRNYQNFPINEYEAQARRLARFEADGQTAATYTIPKEIPHPEFPLTLDLRRPSEF